MLFGIHLAPNNGLQRGFGGIGDDFGINAVATFEQAKDDGFAIRATHRLQTTLTPAQEAIVVQLRKMLLLPLDRSLPLRRDSFKGELLAVYEDD